MLRNLLCLLMLCLLVSTATAFEKNAVEKTTAAKTLLSQSRPLVIAHRGDSKVAPENTLPAFTSAVKAGADLVELDYYHSADGVPIVFHDGDLDRTTNACQLWGGKRIRVSGKTLEELRKLDAGSWFDARFAGTSIPKLDEAIDTIQNGSVTLIERKHGDAATCVKLLTEKNLLGDVVVQAFDWEYLADCHALSPDLVLGALGGKELTQARLDRITASGASVVGWRDEDTSAETIQVIHDHGWKAWVWTVDDPARAVELAQAGVDGIITNRPAAIRAAIESAQATR